MENGMYVGCGKKMIWDDRFGITNYIVWEKDV
jgi:hypothetical protein